LTDRFLDHFDEDLKILSIGHRASTDKQKADLADAATANVTVSVAGSVAGELS
jgi:hypothetical protein